MYKSLSVHEHVRHYGVGSKMMIFLCLLLKLLQVLSRLRRIMSPVKWVQNGRVVVSKRTFSHTYLLNGFHCRVMLLLSTASFAQPSPCLASLDII